MRPSLAPLVLHVMHRFSTGGLENGVVNLINHMDPGAYRHAVLALTEVTDFAKRIRRPDVEFISLNKPPGQGLWHFHQWQSVIRKLQPEIVHTRNLGTLEFQVPAAWAGVKVRIHGEHGRDMSDPDGAVRKYQWIRRAFRPFVHRYVALSQDLQRYLVQSVGIHPNAVTQIYNGVDTERFKPTSRATPQSISGCPFDPRIHFIVGTVGRLQQEKDQFNLVRAFRIALDRRPDLAGTLRLAIVGDGQQRCALQQCIQSAELSSHVWISGLRDDVAAVLQGFHVFALPSRAEGISNTILEAMATGLPVVATAVGGNPELVLGKETGILVPAGDSESLADALLEVYKSDRQQMGRLARQRVESTFSIRRMVTNYEILYSNLLN